MPDQPYGQQPAPAGTIGTTRRGETPAAPPTVGGEIVTTLGPERVGIGTPERRGGHLTRAGMEAVHAGGQSVLFNGRVIPPGEALPSETDLVLLEAHRHDELVRRRNVIDRKLADENVAGPERAGLLGERQQIEAALSQTRPAQSSQAAREGLLRQRQELDDQLARLGAGVSQGQPQSAFRPPPTPRVRRQKKQPAGESNPPGDDAPPPPDAGDASGEK